MPSVWKPKFRIGDRRDVHGSEVRAGEVDQRRRTVGRRGGRRTSVVYWTRSVVDFAGLQGRDRPAPRDSRRDVLLREECGLQKYARSAIGG